MEELLLKIGLEVVYYGVRIGLLFKKDDKKKTVKKKNKKPPKK